MLRSRAALLSAPLLVAATILLLWPASRTPGRSERRDAIFWAANRLVSLQNPDGGWPRGGAGPSLPGSRATVGRSLLWAHNVTGRREHMEAALRAADTLLDAIRRDPAGARALDGVFLVEVGRVTGSGSYLRAALFVHRVRRASRGWRDGSTAAESFLRAAERRDGPTDRNVAVWRALDDVQLALLVGDDEFAEEMARGLVRGMDLDPSSPAGALATGRAAEVFSGFPGDPFSPRVDGWLERLRQAQVLPGIVPGDGAREFVYSQDASHVLRAFVSSRDTEMWALADKGAAFFADRQLQSADGGWKPVLDLTRGAARQQGPDESVGVTADVLLALSRTQRHNLGPI